MGFDMKGFLTFCAALIVICALIYFGWAIGRKINYSLSYEDQTIETVCGMINPEYLKEPCAID